MPSRPSHREASPAYSSSASSEVDSNAPVEEMLALARKYENLNLGPDLEKSMRRAEEIEDMEDKSHLLGHHSPSALEKRKSGVGLIIGDEMVQPDPVSAHCSW